MSASERVAVTHALPRDLASRIDRAFGLALEIGTALLVAAEIVILFVGIVARYAFHRPLIWSDELASLLFLWLAMLGAVLALRRGEHMRMTALVNACPLRVAPFLRAACRSPPRSAFSARSCCRRSTTPRTSRSSRSCRSTSR